MKNLRIYRDLKLLAVIMLVMVSCHLLGLVFPLNSFGVFPRRSSGLFGIFVSPFLHADWSHLLRNLSLLLPLGSILFLLENRRPYVLMALLGFGSGVFTWLIGAPGVHIGASGLVFGLWSHVIFRAWFHRRLKFALGALLVLGLFGSLVFGIFPSRALISWEAHLGGVLSGILTAKYTRFLPHDESQSKKILQRTENLLKQRM